MRLWSWLPILLGGCSLLFQGPGEGASLSDAGPPDAAGEMQFADAMVVTCELPVAVSTCPNERGPTMVWVDAAIGANSVPFCIDSTEVTRAQYREFSDTVAISEVTQIPECLGNTSWDGSGLSEQHPITNVDWCDAFAYCKWAGKALCGSLVDGDPRELTIQQEIADFLSQESQWQYACTDGFSQTYPYGRDPIPGTCADSEDFQGATAVATLCDCKADGPIYDLVGNVLEWIALCNPAVDGCYFVGGRYGDPGAPLRCDFQSGADREYRADDVGFRCCALPEQ